MLPVTQSPLAKLFAKIKAEMVANGTPFADAAAEIAFRTWFDSAWIDSGCTQEFAVLYYPATSTTVSMAVRGSTGHKANVWWGDGSTDSYTLTSDANTAVSKTYAVVALRPIVVLGKLTIVECGGQALGGRLLAHLPSLTYISCWACQLLTGDIAGALARVRPAGRQWLVHFPDDRREGVMVEPFARGASAARAAVALLVTVHRPVPVPPPATPATTPLRATAPAP